ncbi:MAG: lamin tail domain-containing protein, partial [Phycisphaerae bacterium]|nr:lamin tail domain-containing protein [Phycisphaerae bacterium]
MNNSNRSYSDAPLLESLEPRLLLSGSVVISEFMASNNTTTTDGAGNSPDWFELYNPTDTAVDLTGWHLTDNANDLTQWAFPSGGSIDLTLNPGERMLVFASGQDDLDYPYDDGTYYHTNFKLSTNDSGQNEDAMLSDSAGVLVHGYENYARQFTDVSYGIHLSSAWWDTLVGEGDPVAYHVPTAGDASDMPDPGVSEGWTAADFDDSTWTDSMLFGAAGVVISEINTGVPNFVEIQNVSAAAVDSTNWTVLLNDAVGGDINSVDADVWALPSSLAPGEVMYRTDDPGDNYWGGNILWDIDQPGWAMVIDDLGEIVDFAVWGYTEAQIASLDISYGGFSNITVGEQWRGDGVDLVGGGDPKPPQDAIAFGSVWNYMHPLDGQDPALSDADFNSTWMMSAGYDGPVFDNSGQAILGFGSIDYGTVRTNIGTPPSGSRYTGYFRSDFVLDDPMIEVGIEILSDDGAFIYIDGVEVGRNNISPTATDTYTVFAINHTYPDGTNVETQTRTLSIADLDAGTHTIAVSVHQANTGSSDMGLDLRLFGRPLIGGELMRRSGQSDGDTESDFDPNDESTKGVQNPDVILPFGVVLDTTTGIGFSDNQSEFEDVIQTDVSDEMQGVNDSIWTRMEFVASDDLSAFGSLTLGMMYDDGFVAYLNGVQIAQRNAPLALAWDSSATSVHGNSQAVVYEDIDVGMNLLLEGANVLTIHGLNAAADPADFLIRPKLVATGDASVPRHFAVATPNQTNTDQWWQYVEDTEFDHDRGFYIDPFDLVITSDTADAQIYYTTNGASPLMSNGGIDGDATLYAAPIPISTTTVVRAVAIKTDHAPTNVDSHTYIFLDDVINQPDYPTGFPTSWGSHPSEYGMDPDVVNNPLYSGTIKDDLKSIPTMSLVMDIDDIFGAGGIYSNTGGSGVGWERPVSVEMINGDSTTMFQENAGVRIYGGVGRNSSFEKHTLRLLFKSDYGDTKLRYPLFGEDATDEFDTIILRAGFNNTWHRHSGGEENRAQYIRDEWIRQTQLDMDQIGLAGTFVHLYINGLYWGLYNPVERANADFASSYLGGVKEDYDALNSYPRKVVDGTADAWIETQNRSDEIPVDYDRVAEYVDIPNLIDYMLVNFYGGNQDWDDHNWYSVRKREDLAEWKFISWDSERILESITGSNRTGINQHNKPSNIYAGLRSLLEFQVEFADRAHMHLFNGGVLTPAATTARYQELATFIDRAIVGESARWGDSSRTSDPYTRDDEWVAERDRLLYQYFPQRTNVLLGFLRGAGLYPNLDAPVFRIGGSYQHGGEISHAALLSMSSGAGTIYYTTDGTDPRASGGAVNGTQYSGGNITLTQPTRVRARRYDNGEWSALNDATYYINPPTAGELTVTEINYNPHAPTNDELATQQVGDLPFKSSDFEFIELYNTTGHTIDLLDVEFSRGVEVTISSGQQTTLPTGQYALIVANLSAFEARYGTGLNVMGVFTGSLDNSGEMLTFGHPVEATLQELVYNDAGAWPNRADGGGSSLELIDLQGDYADGSNWRSSSEYGGSPGFAGSGPRSDVVVNEIITHSDEPLTDVIELHNTTGSPIDIGGWFLSDGGGDYAKFEIPPGTIIPDGGYAVFYEGHYFEGAFEVDYATEFGGPGEKDFALSGSHGDDVWLLEADVSGKLLSFVDHVEFIGAVNGESFGRWNNGVGDLYPMTSLTLGAANSFPRVGPVIISEVMYNAPDPDGPGGVDPGDLEFIELYNPTSEAIPLAAFANSPHGGPQYFADWRLRGGVDMEFDPGTTIGAQSMLVILSFDPNAPVNAARVADFRLHYGIDASVPLTGGYRGVLDNGGDRITLQRPDSPTAVEPDFVPHVFEDQVRYDDLAPWATSPDGLGDSLQRTPINGWGDDPANWIAGTPDPGAYASINNSPVVDNPIADVTVDEDAVDTVVDLSATFSDPDLNTFTLSVTGNTDAGLVAVSMNVDQLTLSYLADQNGSTDITIRATDTLGAWTEDTFTVTVNPTPDPPTLNNPVAD